ncbi:trimeric intracellular cation channel family protein [Govanella unica]|uniref:Trimeric intracellular cation channel family protein n=1 Tax=Govanella unica TaxID=2975056 RepID=A0A9X3TUB5_9PROT|nr:trimeric intracellular cation channel family protein [Govania unica]MDA5192456.1 trimeric intracellular cation channel family protein [Govania unica]
MTLNLTAAIDLKYLLYICDMIGVGVFAITGGLMAARKGMDIFGFMVLGIVTAIGGGTTRDLILGLPVFWIEDPNYLLVATIAGGAMFFLGHVFSSLTRTLLWLDAAGMALFAVAGAGWAIAKDAPLSIVLFMGVVTACGGGMIRDVLAREVPLVFQREIYAIAALAGAATYGLLVFYTNFGAWAMTAGGAVAFIIRGLAIHFDLSLPVYQTKDMRK